MGAGPKGEVAEEAAVGGKSLIWQDLCSEIVSLAVDAGAEGEIAGDASTGEVSGSCRPKVR